MKALALYLCEFTCIAAFLGAIAAWATVKF
jgi:hypothetical protein